MFFNRFLKARGRLLTFSLACFCALIHSDFLSAAAPVQWVPTKNVEIIVPFAAGGGNDLPARIIEKILTDRKLVPVSTTVVNKPGGGGAVGLNYLNQHLGDAHYLSIISTSTLASHILGLGSVNYTDIEPIVPLVTEYIVFAVSVSSPIKNFKELSEKMKANPTVLSFAIGGGLGNPNHVAIAAALKANGADVRRMKAVAFGGGKEALTAVLGEHVDVLAVAGSILVEEVKARKLRAIAVAAPRRLDGAFNTIPTLKEQGVDLVFGFSRYIVAPKGVSNDQLAYWESVFASLIRSEEWKNALEKNNWNSTYMTSSQTVKDLQTQYFALRSVLTELELAKVQQGK